MTGSPQAARVEITGATRSFVETGLVVDNLDLSIEPGEFVALLGPSGCGKSTLLRMIAGLDNPNSGRVDVSVGLGGRGFVFQEAQLLPWRTALSNTALPLELLRRSRENSQADPRSAARAALEKVGLSDSLNKYPAQLSGGMKMRVSVARALVAEPKLLLLDEPFAALDENTRYRLQEDLRALWQKTRMTVVFVTHSVSEAAFLADRAVVLSARPAGVVLDRRTQLSFARDRATRTDPAYLREIETLTSAFREGESK